jgi:hypothetical protein
MNKNEKRLQEIEKEMDILEEKLSEKDKLWDWTKPRDNWDEYSKYMRPERERLCKLSKEMRMLMPYKLTELSDFGDVMTLKHFIECVKEGGFIDYDGYGRYVKDNQETDIEIHPSDVKHKAIRKEFDTIIWFNR